MQLIGAVPIRIRLVAGFVAAMLVVLTAAGAFVFWRVRVALDAGLSGRLTAQAADLRDGLVRHPADPAAALAAPRSSEQLAQVLDGDGRLLAVTPGSVGTVLLRPQDLAAARSHRVVVDRGRLLLDRNRRLRVLAFPIDIRGRKAVVATAVRLAQRDEALRELLAQLVIANLAALGVASVVGYRLARAALRPVERYRTQAQQITAGDSAVRLDVPDAPRDEVSRLGHTLNDMLAAQAAAGERLRRFVADASHELRTPLTLLTTEVELALRRPRTAEEHQAALVEIAAATARLSALAEQLLELDSGPAGTGQAPVAGALVQAARRAQGCTAVLPDRDALVAQVPPADLDLILGNLVDNAGRHGAPPITLRAERVGGSVRITVADAGQDLDVDFLPHAVERFRRADAARTTPGSGLGLALVHRVVVAAGGELRLCAPGGHHVYPPARSDLPCDHGDGGTTATVLLPAVT